MANPPLGRPLPRDRTEMGFYETLLSFSGFWTAAGNSDSCAATAAPAAADAVMAIAPPAAAAAAEVVATLEGNR